MTEQPTRASSHRIRTAFSRRRLGRAVSTAAIVAAVTCLIGGFVAWHLLGNLRDRSAASLQLLQRTLVNVDESLAIAQDVTGAIGNSLDTVRSSLATLSTGVANSQAALDAVASLTEDVPPALDQVDRALSDVHNAATVVDNALAAIDRLPLAPELTADANLAPAIDNVRNDLRPIATDLRASTTTMRNLSASSDELVAQLQSLSTDLDELDTSLGRSTRLVQRYRTDAHEAISLAQHSLDDLDRDIGMARILAIILAGAIAVGQIAPFHIGRQLAATPTDIAPLAQPDQTDDA